jgi:hypothetical protein
MQLNQHRGFMCHATPYLKLKSACCTAVGARWHIPWAGHMLRAEPEWCGPGL